MLMPVYCDSSSLRVLMLKICQINGLKRLFFSILEPYFLVLYRGAHGIPIAVIKKKVLQLYIELILLSSLSSAVWISLGRHGSHLTQPPVS